jgi:uncharacterized protein YdaL
MINDTRPFVNLGGGGGGGGSAYEATFVNADLTAGVLNVVHSLGMLVPAVMLIDSYGVVYYPDSVTKVDSNECNIDLTSFGTLIGTHTVKIQ